MTTPSDSPRKISSPETLAKQLMSLGSIYLVGGIAEKCFGLLLLPICTYFLSPKDFGAVGLLLLTATVITILIRVPVTSGIYRAYHSVSDSKTRNVLVFNGLLLICLQAAVIAPLFLLFSDSIATMVLGNPEYASVVTVFSAIILFQPVKTYFLALIQIQKRALLLTMVSITRMIVFIAAVFVMLRYLSLGFMGLAYGYLLFAAYDSIVIFPFLRKHMAPGRAPGLLKPVLAYGYPMVFSALSLFLFQFGDRFILRIFSPLGEVGLLTFAATFQVVFLTLVHEPGKKAINPVIFGCENDPVRVRMIVRRSANYLSVFSLGIWICVAIFSREIARVLGRSPEYWDAWKLIPVVSFSGVLFGMNDLAGKGIAMKRKSSLIMKISLICVGINVVLNLLAIPAFGAMGAALATCASFMIMLVLKASFSFRIYGLQFDVKTAGKATVLAMVLFTCGLLCNRLPFYPSIAAKSVLVLSFPLTLFALGILGPEDIRRARSLFSRGANPAEA